ncbi:MAG: hypothetical protein KDI13_05465 [Alphaproteobacteria bacterium]|nr:hypothetical protein [Alphaproteobacteria bacterium]
MILLGWIAGICLIFSGISLILSSLAMLFVGGCTIIFFGGSGQKLEVFFFIGICVFVFVFGIFVQRFGFKVIRWARNRKRISKEDAS